MHIRVPVHCFEHVRCVTAAPLGLLIVGLSILGVLIAGCGSAGRLGDGDRPLPSSGIQLQWGVLENMAGGQNRFESELIIRNQGALTLPDDGWTLFFNFGRSIDTATVTPTVRIDHINGDFYRLRPTERFAPIARGSRTRITFTSGAWAINETDRPDGFYFVWGDEESGRVDPVPDPEVLPFTEERQMYRTAGDRYPVSTSERRYEENRALHALPADDVPKIIPRPNSVEYGGGSFSLDADDVIGYAAGLQGEAEFLVDALSEVLDGRLAAASGDRGEILLSIDPSLPAEGYRLTVSEEGVRIEGGEPAGVFYGVQSLRALVPVEAYARTAAAVEVPHAQIEDAPRFEYRGMHLDVSRTFQGPEVVKRLLDLMSFYKLNKFHFHLTDDEGWRVPIEELPELTNVGGRRGHTLSEEEHLIPSLGSGPFADPERSRGSGYYSRDEFKDILRFAHERHIEVIPEIDLPGHARAAIVAMEARTRRTGSDEYLLSDPLESSEYRSVQMFEENVINVCMPSAYRFIETVVDDIVEMYREADVPMRALHTGGDEVPHGVWEQSPACEELMRRSGQVNSVDDLHDYFLRRFDDILDRHDLVTAGWEEIALHERNGQSVPNPAFVGAGFRPYVWNAVWGWGGEDNAYKLANAGYDVVISNAGSFYFDLAHEKHPEEPGMYWAGFVSTRAPFEFLPYDLYRSAEIDLMGNPIADTAYARAERLTLGGREHLLGLQGQLWGETIENPERIDYMIFPRLISLAERAWAERPRWALIDNEARRTAALEEDWNLFANALGSRELRRLDHLWDGVRYRIPPPGAIIENDVLKANVALPGMEIRFTTDGSEPTSESTLYEGAVRAEGEVRLRAFSMTGRGSRTVSAEPVE